MIIDRATQYAKDVMDGKIIAGHYVKLACQRHLNDLERQNTAEFPYYWDVEESQRIINFAETLLIDEGEEIQPLQLYDFQCFILGSLMGWYNNKGFRRFRDDYIQIGRQNGKSLLNGVLATYMGGFDGYRNGRIICCATKADQAKIVWQEIEKFINADDDLAESFHIYKDRKIVSLATNTEISFIGRDTKSLDGFRTYLSILDELHAHPNNAMFRLARGGQRKLKQCLTSCITTAGFDLNSFCKEHYDYCVRVVEGLHVDEAKFIYIAQLDKDDDIWDWQNWGKANPLNLFTHDNQYDMDAISILKNEANEVKEKGGKDLADFITKALNTWYTYNNSQYLNLEKFKQCGSKTTLADMTGKECYLGIDLSQGGDLTSLGFVFPLDDEKLYIHSHSFIPNERVLEHEKTDDVPYRVWINNKLLTVTTGYKTDYKYIIAYLKEIIEKYQLQIIGCGYDSHNASSFLADLEEIGLDPIEVKQSARALNEATTDFKLTVDDNKIIYDKKNDLLKWSFGNAVLDHNSFGECKIKKDLGRKRIDPCDSIIDAWTLYVNRNNTVDMSKYSNADYLTNLYK